MKPSWEEIQETVNKLSILEENDNYFFYAKQIPKDRLIYLGWFPEDNDIQFVDYIGVL